MGGSAEALSALCNRKIRGQPCRHASLVCLSECCYGDRRPLLLVELALPHALSAPLDTCTQTDKTMHHRKHLAVVLIFITHTINIYQSKANNASHLKMKVIFVHYVNILPKIRDIYRASEIAPLPFLAHGAQLYFHI